MKKFNMNYIEYISNQLTKKFTLIIMGREDYKNYKKEVIGLLKTNTEYSLIDEPIDHNSEQIIIAKRLLKIKKTKESLIEEEEEENEK